jgi:hypothetical protein
MVNPKKYVLGWIGVLLHIVIHKIRDYESRCEYYVDECGRKKKEFYDSLPIGYVEDAISAGVCPMSHYCSHSFALRHDMPENLEYLQVFQCSDLPDCWCKHKRIFGCDDCAIKQKNFSLCWPAMHDKRITERLTKQTANNHGGFYGY